MFVVLQLLLDPWGEALKRAGGLKATVQPLQTPSKDAHPLIQLNIQKNLSYLYLCQDWADILLDRYLGESRQRLFE